MISHVLRCFYQQNLSIRYGFYKSTDLYLCQDHLSGAVGFEHTSYILMRFFRSTKVPSLASRLNVPASCLVLQPIFFFCILVHYVLCFFSCSDLFELRFGRYDLMVIHCAVEFLIPSGSQLQPPVI